MRIRNWGLVVAAIFVFTGCNARDEVRSLQSATDSKKVWVFVQINVPREGGGIADYFYYARMSHSMYSQIKHNEMQRGFLLLSDVRYYGKDDRYHYYRDDDEAGELVFRIEDIRKIDLLRRGPEVEEQAAEPDSNAKIETPANAAKVTP